MEESLMHCSSDNWNAGSDGDIKTKVVAMGPATGRQFSMVNTCTHYFAVPFCFYKYKKISQQHNHKIAPEFWCRQWNK